MPPNDLLAACVPAEVPALWARLRALGRSELRVAVPLAELALLDPAPLLAAIAEGARVRLLLQMGSAGEGTGAALRLALRRLHALEAVELAGPDRLTDADAVTVALEVAASAARAAGVPLQPVSGSFPTCILLAAIPDAVVPGRPTGAEHPERYFGGCHVCAARQGCPGASAEAWGNAGSGALDPPQVVLDPWQLADIGGIGPLQSVVEVTPGDLAASRRALEDDPAPTRWLFARAWQPGLPELPFTHLAVEFDAQHLPLEALEALARLDRPFAAALHLPADPLDVLPIVALLQRLGALSVALFGGERWSVLDRARLGLPPAARSRAPAPEP